MIYTDTARNNADAFEGSGSGDAKMKEEKERFFFFLICLIQFQKVKTFYLLCFHKIFLTKSSKPVNPARDRLPCQPVTDIVAEVIAILCDEMVCVPRIFLC